MNAGPLRDPTISHLVSENEGLKTDNLALRAALWATLAIGTLVGALTAFTVTIWVFVPLYQGLTARVVVLESQVRDAPVERPRMNIVATTPIIWVLKDPFYVTTTDQSLSSRALSPGHFEALDAIQFFGGTGLDDLLAPPGVFFSPLLPDPCRCCRLRFSFLGFVQ